MDEHIDGSGEEPGRYHHGNLRQALIEAGLAIIAESGLAALTLRACAARAGVSHAAPAHHFGSLQGLLSELAGIAFRRFHLTIANEQARCDGTPEERLRAAARGYLRFATANPDLFRLMFSAKRLDWSNPELSAASRAAYDQLGETVRPFQRDDSEAESTRLRILVWSTVHGYAHLLLEGYFANRGVSDDGLSHLPDLAALLPGVPDR
ncbi:MAG: TetR/AcrR family transcriptional regulator [Alphaproteobacteria bacterium]